MRKLLKKIEEQFKAQNIVRKVQFITYALLLVFLFSFFIRFVWTELRVKYSKVKAKITLNQVRSWIPLTGVYSIAQYGDNTLGLVLSKSHKKVVKDRFTSVEYIDVSGDSVLILSGKKGMRTFSLKTGLLSDDYYDIIYEPDDKHNYCACTRKSTLGFLDCHSGKLVIPMIFYNNGVKYEYRYNKDLADISYMWFPREDIYNYIDDKRYADVKFKGDFCVVGTGFERRALIDINGNIITDGWFDIEINNNTIEAYSKINDKKALLNTKGEVIIDDYERLNSFDFCNLIEIKKNNQYFLYSTIEKKFLPVAKESEPEISPLGIMHTSSLVLTDFSCKDTLTDIVLGSCNCKLIDYGFTGYKIVHNYLGCDNEYEYEYEYEYDYDIYYYDESERKEQERYRKEADNTYIVFNDYDYDTYRICNKGLYEGLYEESSGDTIIPAGFFSRIEIYRNNKKEYIFKCYVGGDYSLLIDKNGCLLSKGNYGSKKIANFAKNIDVSSRRKKHW